MRGGRLGKFCLSAAVSYWLAAGPAADDDVSCLHWDPGALSTPPSVHSGWCTVAGTRPAEMVTQWLISRCHTQGV